MKKCLVQLIKWLLDLFTLQVPIPTFAAQALWPTSEVRLMHTLREANEEHVV